MGKRIKTFFYQALSLMLLCNGLWAENAAMLNDLNTTQQQQYYAVAKELRCLVCQNEDLLDSQAPLAADLRKQIHDMVLQHKKTEMIKQYFTTRYGDYILYNPPLQKNTYFLWFAPVFIFIITCILFWIYLRKNKKEL